MKCRCLAYAPERCGHRARVNGLCDWCRFIPSCRRNHMRNAIAAIWRATWRRSGRRWGQ